MVRLLRANRITGWRRQIEIHGRARSPLRAAGKTSRSGAHGVTRPTFRVKPDFIFLKSRTAIFVDGCFWHGCPKHATWPAHRAAWWRRKIEGNKTRDRVVNRTLRRAGRVKWRGHHAVGWRVLRIWECDLAKFPETCVRRIQRVLG